MSRKTERMGTRVLPGLWKLDRSTWIIRAQRKCPHTERKTNRRRLLKGVTRAEALNALEELRAELEGVALPVEEVVVLGKEPLTVKKYADKWLRNKQARADLARSTELRYATALDRLSPWLKSRALPVVNRGDIQEWMAASRKRYSARTVNGWLRVLRACLNEAVADAHIATNPASQVKPLREEVDLEDTNSLPACELRRVILALENQSHTIHAAATTQAFTGLRWGEVTALKWEDLDEAAGVLRIRRAVSERQLRPVTKSKKARTVGVPELLLGILQRHRALLAEEEHPGRESGLIFPSQVGTPLTSGRISDALREACGHAGIKQRFTSHGFRRSLTDLLRQARVDPVVAAGLTGHETERMRRHYSTVRDGEAAKVGEEIALLLAPVEPPASRADPGQPSRESTTESSKESTKPPHEKTG